MEFDPSTYRANKYKEQATTYSSMVSGVEGSLSSAIGELNRSSQMLNFDSGGSNDLLSYNVASNTESIKGKIAEVQSNLTNYAQLISAKAADLDNEELQLYNEYVARIKASRKKANSVVNKAAASQTVRKVPIREVQ